jgi:hypothetical protein
VNALTTEELPPPPACYPCDMEHLLRIYGVGLRVVIIAVLFFLVLELLCLFVAFYWPCDLAWQPFGSYNPRCASEAGGGIYPTD